MPDPGTDINQPGAPTMQGELDAMSNPSRVAAAAKVAATRQAAVQANATQGLAAALGGQGAVPPSVNDQIASHMMRDEEIDPAHPDAYLQAGATRLSKMKQLADSSKKVGNTQAFNTYTQVYNVLSQHMRDLYSKHAAGLSAQADQVAQRHQMLTEAQKQAAERDAR